MKFIKKSFQLIWKFFAYCLVFMVNPKAVIFKEVDDELEKEEAKEKQEKAANA